MTQICAICLRLIGGTIDFLGYANSTLQYARPWLHLIVIGLAHSIVLSKSLHHFSELAFGCRYCLASHATGSGWFPRRTMIWTTYDRYLRYWITCGNGIPRDADPCLAMCSRGVRYHSSLPQVLVQHRVSNMQKSELLSGRRQDSYHNHPDLLSQGSFFCGDYLYDDVTTIHLHQPEYALKPSIIWCMNIPCSSP